MISRGRFRIHVLPRVAWTWEEFLERTPCNSLALDGMVRGGPRWDEQGRRINFDHHDGVVREVTMSTCMQVHFAIKGGLMRWLRPGEVHVFINDTDQDTSLAIIQLLNAELIEGTGSLPVLNRLLDLNNKLDITAGAFPMNLRDQLLRQHNWLFEPYTKLRKTGALAIATESVLEDNLEAILRRFSEFHMGQAGEVELDTRHELLYDGVDFKLVDEIGGNEARWHLFSRGMQAYVSLVAHRPDGRFVYTIGRRSRYVSFPVTQLYADLNEAEGLTDQTGWNGSDIVGGSSRFNGSGLPWQDVRDIVLKRLHR